MADGYGEIANPEIFSNNASLSGSISFEVLSSDTVKWLLYVSRSVPAQTGVGLGTYTAASDLRLYGRRITTDVTENIPIVNSIENGTSFNSSFYIDYLNAKASVRYNNETLLTQSFLNEGYSASNIPEVAYIGNGVAATGIDGNFFGALVRINKLPTDFHRKVDTYLTKNLLPSEINLFIVFGQSNTDGRVNVSDGEAWLQDSQVDQVKVWDSQNIGNYYLDKTGKSGNGSSWVTSQTTNKFSFAHVALKNIAEVMDNVVVCQVTSGGTALSPAAYARGSWCPDYNEVPEGTPRLLEDLVNRISNLMSFCSLNDIKVNFKAIIAHQGESDSQRRLEDPDLYQARWSKLIGILRSVAEDPELPVIYGTVPSSSLWYDATIRQAHLDFAAADPNAYCRDNEGISMLSDELHFDAQGSEEFGNWASTTFNNL
nr:sialate O-acetylesterase [Pseudoalteromonas sp. Ps84H-4]